MWVGKGSGSIESFIGLGKITSGNKLAMLNSTLLNAHAVYAIYLRFLLQERTVFKTAGTNFLYLCQ